MSRALSLVPTCWRMSPLRVSHPSAKRLVGVDDLGALGVVLRGVVAGEVRVVVVDAVDRRRALAGAARIPSDDVEPLPERPVVDLGGSQREHAAAEPGPARVHEQRADLVLLIERVVARQVELERRAVRVAVVDRNIERADVDSVVELRPLDRLRLERRAVQDAYRRLESSRSLAAPASRGPRQTAHSRGCWRRRWQRATQR